MGKSSPFKIQLDRNSIRKINFKNEENFSIVLGVMYDSNRNNIISLNFDLILFCKDIDSLPQIKIF